MAKSKKDKKLIVNQVYFELIERKAKLLDSMYEEASPDAIEVSTDDIKECGNIRKAWGKADASRFENTEKPYEEPKTTDEK